MRGRRESRAPTAPAAPCAMGSEETHTGLTGTAETSRLSPRNGLRLIRALPGERPFLPPLPAGKTRQRSARVAAPGPHDFAVRVRRFVRRIAPADTCCVHRIPDQRAVTIAIRPLTGQERDELWHGFVFLKSGIFFRKRLDTIRVICPSRQSVAALIWTARLMNPASDWPITCLAPALHGGAVSTSWRFRAACYRPATAQSKSAGNAPMRHGTAPFAQATSGK